ncbi:MAG: acyltransferase family protein [Actinobacteria bacterium]|uniref:Unannotated protein n=1 Tax=freshwater metagenome TaxID=449393 RepID=A0A6J7MQG8_9ZZZZ|nr:acyltransferase family protein [Actinomycetota bacterium]
MSVPLVEAEIEAGGRFGYRPEFDGLRGVAILGVVMFHYFRNWFRGSIIGVDLFFVLSGFLITRLLFEERRKYGNISLPDFYARRVGRLFPGLVVVSLVLLVGDRLFIVDSNFRALVSGAIGAVTFTTNWLRVAGVDTSELSHLWSIAIEQQFYLLWPLVVLAVGVSVRRINRMSAAIVVAAGVNLLVRSLAGVGPGSPSLFNGLDTHGMLTLGAGCWLATTLTAENRWGNRQVLLTVGLLLAVAARCVLVVIPDTEVFYRTWARGGAHLTAVAMVVVLVAAKELSWMRFLLSRRALMWLGQRAYSMFLWHQPVRSYLPIGPVSGLVLRNLVFLAVSLVVSEFSYRLVEQPGRKWIVNRFSRRGRQAAPASV